MIVCEVLPSSNLVVLELEMEMETVKLIFYVATDIKYTTNSANTVRKQIQIVSYSVKWSSIFSNDHYWFHGEKNIRVLVPSPIRAAIYRKTMVAKAISLNY